jgi:TetR/AcrR family transcriptional regulator, transcriptional repressor for nem operon
MNKPAERSSGSATATRILEVAEHLAQTRGFNGFSYADIADKLCITKASLHYHFATKAQLGCALIVGYTKKFGTALSEIDVANPHATLCNYVQLYEDVLVRDRMCLCGMFAAEYSTLPPAMQHELRHFFNNNEAWLTKSLERGRTAGALHFEGSALEAARALTAGLEGAMLLARSYEDAARFTATAQRLLTELGVSRPAATGAMRNEEADEYGARGRSTTARLQKRR